MYDNDTEPTFPTDLLTIDQLSPAALSRLLDRAARIKAGEEAARLDDRTVAMVFEKPSTRTRTSFEAGVTALGGHPTFLGQDDIHLGHGEPIKDTARALSQYVGAIVARLNSHDDLTELAAHADVPVVNALTERAHPCQTLADLLTLRELAAESGGSLSDVTLAWVGDGNNVARSLVVGCALAGVDLRVATPEGYGVDDDAVAAARAAGGEPTLFDSAEAAVAGADAIYTDVWMSMGEGESRAEKLPAFEGFQVGEDLLGGGAKLMHCLPANRGEEVTDDALESEQSVVWQQAGNRKPTQQALLLELLGE
ncbi:MULTISPECIES: ornithine carbamoyltransferase [Halolamina]|uniref:Ornithine carbamoyltransferase n=1 Tax=Halolamina pelagica TaxID=699431 RepID=A0A1I5P4Z7_9EURY|nr:MULTISPECIES: ornithine carbamoyltransferase [Halolamina]NHX36607.1 ornithine carbamoyltransferase [Halolamina sp. R1-12]SFP28566.1 ornithine carbamoyltransferase [Halolamina pelagica]